MVLEDNIFVALLMRKYSSLSKLWMLQTVLSNSMNLIRLIKCGWPKRGHISVITPPPVNDLMLVWPLKCVDKPDSGSQQTPWFRTQKSRARNIQMAVQSKDWKFSLPTWKEAVLGHPLTTPHEVRRNKNQERRSSWWRLFKGARSFPIYTMAYG